MMNVEKNNQALELFWCWYQVERG